MRVRRILAVAVATAAVMALAATAFADGTLSIVASQSTVTYPHRAQLLITTPVALEETITVEARLVDGDWSVVGSVPATAAALGTTFTVAPKLKVTSGVRALQAGVESEVTTVSVRARLNPISVTRRHRAVWNIRGSIMPAHAIGTTITIQAWRKTVTGKGASRVVTLTPLPDLTATVFRTNRQISWYKTTFSPDASGQYVFKALHADAGHVDSYSKSKTVKLKIKPRRH